MQEISPMDFKLELVVLPVSDVDRARGRAPRDSPGWLGSHRSGHRGFRW